MNRTELFETAVKQAKAGERTQARNLLLELVELEPKHELAWLWLSELVEEPEDKIIALENALTINPHRPQTQARLSKLRAKYEAARQPAAEHFATNGFSVVATIEEVEFAEIQQELTNGQMQAGREQLAGFLRRYANHEAGWWLMVKYADTQSNQLIALDHVLRLNRQHPEAPMVLDQITPTVKDSLALGRIYERLEQWEKSEYYYKRALVSSSNADRLLAKKHLTHVSEQVRLGNIKYTSPAATVVRLAAGPMLLYTLLVLVQSGLKPLQVSPVLCTGNFVFIVGLLLWGGLTYYPEHPWLERWRGTAVSASKNISLRLIAIACVALPILLLLLLAISRLLAFNLDLNNLP
ncbi:MAG: hypothetical protein H6657_30380 [Ardenticatenaceae bacterium]|nr:hypothetical protein [Ardenticatenaceae bacterium]